MILVFEIFLAGGVAYTGIKTFRRRKRLNEAVCLTNYDKLPLEPTDLSAPDKISFAELERKINRDFSLSSVSLGLSITGALAYPPLGVASIPLTIYGALPTFENAFASIFSRNRTKVATVSSIVIVGTLVTDHYTWASVIQWIYHLNQKLLIELNYAYRQFLIQLFGPGSRSIWIMLDDVEIQIARDELKVGDVVVVHEGELVPVDGTIVDGGGLIDMYIITGQSRPVEKNPGDKVFAATSLLSGKICIRVEKAR